MHLIIEARIAEAADVGHAADGAVTLAVLEHRRDRSLAKLGLTLAEGRALLARAQDVVVSQQVDEWMSGETNCRRCGTLLSHKDSRSIVVRTCMETWLSGALDCGRAAAVRRRGQHAAP